MVDLTETIEEELWCRQQLLPSLHQSIESEEDLISDSMHAVNCLQVSRLICPCFTIPINSCFIFLNHFLS
jgi:hypothetical protein